MAKEDDKILCHKKGVYINPNPVGHDTEVFYDEEMVGLT